MTRGWLPLAGVAWLVIAPVAAAAACEKFPPDTVPEGAYARVAIAVNRGRPQEFFAYLETEAQHACYTIGGYRREAQALVLADYPVESRPAALELLALPADGFDGPDVFAHYARQRAWFAALRRDLSGIKNVREDGQRATVETVRGTRYSFRKRDNGIWGLTQFTAPLVQEATRAARDLERIKEAAADYRRTRGAAAP